MEIFCVLPVLLAMSFFGVIPVVGCLAAFGLTHLRTRGKSPVVRTMVLVICAILSIPALLFTLHYFHVMPEME